MTRPRLALLLAVVTLAALAVGQEPAGRKLALLVGVQRYSDGTGLRNLDYTEQDAADLAAVLAKQGYRVTVLTRAEAVKQDRDFLRPTAKNIRDHLKSVATGRKPEDTVLVALSGHGAHLKSTDKLYFCPQETDLADPRSLLAIDDVMALLDDRACLAGNKVLLVDACRNDPADGATTGTPAEVKSVSRPLVPDPPGGTVALFSCSKGQISHESRAHKRGFLFHHVIEGLGGKAATKKGEVTWLSLAGYVAEELPEAVKAEKGPLARQTPEVLGRSRAMVLARGDGETRTAPDRLTGATFRSPATGMEFVRIPKGTFLMGSPASEKGRFDDEAQHEVTLTRDFYMGKCEVTRGQFRKFVDATGYKTEAEASGEGGYGFEGPFCATKPEFTWRSPGFDQTDDHPVVLVSWNDAMRFCVWLSQRDGRVYRLPTEAEWEYSCRGGATSSYHFGTDWAGLSQYANVADASSKRRLAGHTWAIDTDDGYVFTAPVGKLQPNPFGLSDMHGNVYEWCSDWYDDKYPSVAVIDPTGPSSGSKRVRRGGSWDTNLWECRSASREYRKPADRTCGLGFRCALVPSGR